MAVSCLDIVGNAIDGRTKGEIETLSLTRHKIETLGTSLRGLSALHTLDLSRNLLSSLQGLSCLPSLARLSLYYNRISNANELLHLQANTQLSALDLRLNAVTRASCYRAFVLQSFPSLEVLDERIVGELEKSRYKKLSPILPAELSSYESSDEEDQDSQSRGAANGFADRNIGEGLKKCGNESGNANSTISVSPDDGGNVQHVPVLCRNTATSPRSARPAVVNVRWRAEIAGYADGDPAQDSPRGGMRYTDTLLQELVGMVSSAQFSDQNAKQAVQNIVDQVCHGRSEELREHKNEILKLRAQNERQLEQHSVRQLHQVVADPQNHDNGTDVDEQIAELLSQKSDLVEQLDALRQQHARYIQAEQHVREVSEKAAADGAVVQHELRTLRAENNRLRKALSDTETMPKLTASSDGDGLIESDRRGVGAEDAHEILGMLREAHRALMRANRGLLTELDDVKSRYAEDSKLWEANFEALRMHHSDERRGQLRKSIAETERELGFELSHR